MQFTDSCCAYQLLGVYHIQRPSRNVDNRPRKFVGIGFRIRGGSVFSYDGKTFEATTGSTLFLPADTAFRNSNPEPEELIAVHLKPLTPTPGDFRLYPDTGHLEPLFRRLAATWETGDYNRSMGLLYEIFGALEAPEAVLPAAIAPGVRLLHREFKNPRLTIAQAAEACFVSEVYFRRVYRQHFGTSPLQAVLQLRFDYAGQLLRSGYYTVEQAARQAGFSDVKYFRTAFTKRFGLTPTQYCTKELCAPSERMKQNV